MIRELEAIVWCSKCQTDKFTIYRKEVRPGIFVNEREPDIDEHKFCKDCGEVLTRHE